MTTDQYGPMRHPEERQTVPDRHDPVSRTLEAYQVWRAYAGKDAPSGTDEDELADSLAGEALKLLHPHKGALSRVTPKQLDAILQGIILQQEPQPAVFVYAVLAAADLEKRWSEAFEPVIARCHRKYPLFPRLDACW